MCKKSSTVAIVVTYNRLEKLKVCIECLKKQSFKCDIMIVDNNSTDDTKTWMDSNNKNIMYYRMGNNIGGAGGFNYGIKKAVELNYDYIWIMDDDCFPNENALEELVKANIVLDGLCGWLSSVSLWKDGHECKMNRQKLKKSFYNYSEYLEYGIIQAEQATFVSLFLSRDVVLKVGLPIKEFFIWGDDIEYTRRISTRHNIPSFVVGKSKVVHAMQENNGSSISTDSEERLERYKRAFKNENYLYRQEGFKGVCYYIGKCGINFLRIIKNSPNKRLKRIAVLLSGMMEGLFFNPSIEYVTLNERGDNINVEH